MSNKGTEKPKTPAAPEKKADGKTPRERFLSVGASRVSKAIKGVRNVKNIASRKSYEYSEAEVSKAMTAIQNEVDSLRATFAAALAGKGAAPEKETFTFS